MLRHIIKISILLLCIEGSVLGQNQFATDLLQKEYAFFYAKNDTLKQVYLIDKLRLHMKNNSLGKTAFDEVKRVRVNALPDSLKAAFFWDASVLAYLNHEEDYSLSFLKKYTSFTRDTSVKVAVFTYLISYSTPSDVSTTNWQKIVETDTSLACLKCLEEVEAYQAKHKKFKTTMALLLPGSGLMLNGNVGSGFISLALNAATFFALRFTIQQQLWLNTFLWGTNLGGKFYLGGFKLTSNKVMNKEALQRKKLATTCELHVLSVLERYPLTFKLLSR